MAKRTDSSHLPPINSIKESTDDYYTNMGSITMITRWKVVRYKKVKGYHKCDAAHLVPVYQLIETKVLNIKRDKAYA